MANYEVQIKLRTDGTYSNLYPTVPPAVSGQITKNAQDIGVLKNKALPAKPNQRLYYNATGGGSNVTVKATDLLKYSCIVATIKATDGTVMNTAPMYFNGNVANGFASEWGAASVKCVVNVRRQQPNPLGETGDVNVWGPTGSGAGGSLIALIGVI